MSRNSFLAILPRETSTLILGNLSLEQLIAFRCSCNEFNNFVLGDQSAIVRGVLRNVVYGSTATILYLDLAPPSPWAFTDLVNIARRCWIAREMAHLLTQCRATSHYCLCYSMYRSRDRQSFSPARFAKKAYPYLLALIQFFEEYRYRLASFVSDPNAIETPSDHVERLILARYNEMTVNRLCALYHILLDLFGFSFPYERPLSMFALLGIIRANYPSPTLDDGEHLDFFTFGGLEVLRDVITRHHRALDIVVAHYSRVTPIGLPVTYDGRPHTTLLPLKRSILPPVNDPNNVTATRICLLLPKAADFLRNGHSTNEMYEERAEFLRYLRSDVSDGNEEEGEEEEEPNLLR